MMRRPVAVAHVVLLGFAMAACGAEKPAVAPAPPFEPAAALAEASTFIAEGAYRFEIVTFGPGVSGTIHAPTRSAELESTEYRQDVEVRTKARYVGAKSFFNVRMSGGRADHLIGRLSVAALKPGSGLPIPITVTINPDRTIAELGMTMPGKGSEPGSGWKVRFLDHREAPPVPEPPSSDVKKPSDALMTFYRNGGRKG